MSSRHAWVYRTGSWDRLRKAQLIRAPLCRYCIAAGVVTAATVVDHIRPHKGNRDLAFDPDNVQSLCAPCHDRHKQILDSGKRAAICDEDGWPLDGRPTGGYVEK